MRFFISLVFAIILGYLAAEGSGEGWPNLIVGFLVIGCIVMAMWTFYEFVRTAV